MVKKLYVYFNPITETYFFNNSNHPKDDKRVEIRNGNTLNLPENLRRYFATNRHSVLYVGESVPEEVKNAIKQNLRDSRLEVEVKKGL